MKFRAPRNVPVLLLMLVAAACSGTVEGDGRDDRASPAGAGGSAGDRPGGTGGATHAAAGQGDAGAGGPGGTSGASGGSTGSAGSPGIVAGGGGSLVTTADAGVAADAGARVDSSVGTVPMIVAVGYGGLRVVSRDGGKTWTNRQVLAPQGGDDENLLRVVRWVDGQFVAVGWKVMTSPDGITWTERSKRGLHDCVTFANGTLYVVNLRGGDTQQSKDRGATWAPATRVDCQANLDYASNGVRLRTMWQGIIERSENGGSFQAVYRDPQSNHPSAFGEGLVAR